MRWRPSSSNWSLLPSKKSRIARGRGRPPPRTFSEGAGRLLLDGGFRRDVDAAEVEALRRIARERFLQWMSVS